MFIDPYSGYRSPYGPPGPLGDPSGSANPSLNNNMAAGSYLFCVFS